MKFDKSMLLLYAVTNGCREGRQSLAQKVESALKGGATLIQLREKNLDPPALTALAAHMTALCHRYHVPLIVNDSVEAALASGADGVHVGADDTPVAEIRKSAPAGFIIGATCKTVEQAYAAARAGADYMGVGAVFPSPTKQNALRITVEQLREICACVSIPAVGIGGIHLENLTQLNGCGIQGVAVVSALFGAADIEATARVLKERIKAVVSCRSVLGSVPAAGYSAAMEAGL